MGRDGRRNESRKSRKRGREEEDYADEEYSLDNLDDDQSGQGTQDLFLI